MKRLKEILQQLSTRGLPLLWIKDPVSKLPSVSLTMLLISFGLVILALVNLSAKLLKGIDIQNSMYLFIVTSGLYFGRSIVRKDDKGNSIDIQK